MFRNENKPMMAVGWDKVEIVFGFSRSGIASFLF